MPRCCIVTAYRRSEYAALAELTLPRMQAFATRHGHELRVHRMEDTHLDRAWMKVPPILDALQGDFEFVVWLDIDALILRLDRDILDKARPGIDLLVSWHGPDTAQLEDPAITPHYKCGNLPDPPIGLVQRLLCPDVGPAWTSETRLERSGRPAPDAGAQ